MVVNIVNINNTGNIRRALVHTPKPRYIIS